MEKIMMGHLWLYINCLQRGSDTVRAISAVCMSQCVAVCLICTYDHEDE